MFHVMSALTVVLLLVSCTLLLFLSVDAAKILMASPQFRSHVIVQQSVGEALVRRGHRVFVALASRFPSEHHESLSGVEVLHFHYPSDELYAVSDEMERKLADLVFIRRSDPFAEPRETTEIINRECELMMSDQEFMARVRAENFDLVIVDPFILAPCTLVLPAVLGVRFVTLTGFYFPWSIGLPALPSFFGLPGPRPALDLKSSFVHRLGNTIGGYLAFRYIFFPIFDNTTLLHMKLPGVADWDELLVRSELFLMENDHWLDDPEPLFPNTVAVAGLTASPAKSLPPMFAQIYDAASDDMGVIVVSFGSTAYRMPDRFVRRLLDAFRRLNETIVARFNVPDGVDVPENVKLMKWLPQNDLLGNRKTRLFVTHCGSHGQYEALFHGVPMLGLPMFAEQIWNCDRARRKHFGLTIADFFDDGGKDDEEASSVWSTRLYDVIRELLDNRTYGDAVSRTSEAWRHAEPLIGSEKAGFWIDHVIKHGSDHLRSSTVGMPLYQFLMLDVLAMAVSSLLFIALVSFFLIRALLRRIIFGRIQSKPRIAESKKVD